MREPVISSLYNCDEYGVENIITVSTDFSSVRKWIKLYAGMYININQNPNGAKLNIVYYNDLQSSSSFQTIGDVIKLVKNWTTLKKQEDRAEFYINGEYVGDSVEQLVTWYENCQYS